MRKIGFKLWSGMMLLVTVLLVLIWLFQIVFLDQFYKNIKISEVINKGTNIIHTLEDRNNLENATSSPEFLDQIDNFAYQSQISVIVVDKNQNTLYQNVSNDGMMGRGMMRNMIGDVYDAALTGTIAKLEGVHPKFQSDYMMIGLPIHIEDSVGAVMLINLPLAPVEDTVSVLKHQLFWITMILLIVTVVISYYLSQLFTRPIIKLHALAKNYSNGEFDRRVDIEQEDELGFLAKQMNRMGEELAKNENLRRELIANISHELRTPLSLIRGYAETIKDVSGDNPVKREKQLGIIIDESERLTHIVEDILSLSQYQAGAIKFNIQSISFNTLLSKVMLRYETEPPIRDIRIIGLTNEVYVLADQNRIEQVLYNLINNAIQHTKEDGQIRITVVQKEFTLRIEISDNGEGIAKSELPYVFERFYNGKKVERCKTGGTGLGLAIVKGILEMHQSQYGVQSEEGSGTTFWFELPKSNSHTSF